MESLKLLSTVHSFDDLVDAFFENPKVETSIFTSTYYHLVLKKFSSLCQDYTSRATLVQKHLYAFKRLIDKQIRKQIHTSTNQLKREFERIKFEITYENFLCFLSDHNAMSFLKMKHDVVSTDRDQDQDRDQDRDKRKRKRLFRVKDLRKIRRSRKNRKVHKEEEEKSDPKDIVHLWQKINPGFQKALDGIADSLEKNDMDPALLIKTRNFILDLGEATKRWNITDLTTELDC